MKIRLEIYPQNLKKFLIETINLNPNKEILIKFCNILLEKIKDKDFEGTSFFSFREILKIALS